MGLKKLQCEGYTKPGAFQVGAPAVWTQCTNEAIVMLSFKENKKTKALPACKKCWNDCIEHNYKITKAKPI